MLETRKLKMCRATAVLLLIVTVFMLLPFSSAMAEENTDQNIQAEQQAEESAVVTDEAAVEADDDAAEAEDAVAEDSDNTAEPAEDIDEPSEEDTAEPAAEETEVAVQTDAETETVLEEPVVEERFGTNSDGSRYYLNPKTGRRQTGWLCLDGVWYYFDKNAKMVTGWCLCNDGYWYYFDKDTGAIHRGWLQYGNYRYYLREDNARVQTGWKKIDGNWYYFWDSGKMATAWAYCSDGAWYYFDKETGIVHRGWAKSGDEWYYMRPEDARKQTGWRKIDGYYYYFDSEGRMCTGWQLIGGYKYYFYKATDKTKYPVGSNAFNVVVDGYYVNKNGYTTASWGIYERMEKLAEMKVSDTNYLIMIDYTYCRLGVFKGSKGNWENIYYWQCSPGAYSTPTVRGTFKINSKGQYFYGSNTGCRCWYWSEFHGGDYAIHSVLYTPSGNSISDGRLGMHISHGCVRIALDNAYFIYKNCPIGTAVIVY